MQIQRVALWQVGDAVCDLIETLDFPPSPPARLCAILCDCTVVPYMPTPSNQTFNCYKTKSDEKKTNSCGFSHNLNRWSYTVTVNCLDTLVELMLTIRSCMCMTLHSLHRKDKNLSGQVFFLCHHCVCLFFYFYKVIIFAWSSVALFPDWRCLMIQSRDVGNFPSQKQFTPLLRKQ